VIAYVDASVLLRFVFDQPERLQELTRAAKRFTSSLTGVECLRTVDNARLRGELDDDEYIIKRQEVYRQIHRMHRLAPVRSVLRRAGETYPAVVKTLDCIHLATALQLRERDCPDLVFATHDRQLGRVAAALDFTVIGVP